jgi:hypothetical protein
MWFVAMGLTAIPGLDAETVAPFYDYVRILAE